MLIGISLAQFLLPSRSGNWDGHLFLRFGLPIWCLLFFSQKASSLWQPTADLNYVGCQTWPSWLKIVLLKPIAVFSSSVLASGFWGWTDFVHRHHRRWASAPTRRASHQQNSTSKFWGRLNPEANQWVGLIWCTIWVAHRVTVFLGPESLVAISMKQIVAQLISAISWASWCLYSRLFGQERFCRKSYMQTHSHNAWYRRMPHTSPLPLSPPYVRATCAYKQLQSCCAHLGTSKSSHAKLCAHNGCRLRRWSRIFGVSPVNHGAALRSKMVSGDFSLQNYWFLQCFVVSCGAQLSWVVFEMCILHFGCCYTMPASKQNKTRSWCAERVCSLPCSVFLLDCSSFCPDSLVQLVVLHVRHLKLGCLKKGIR